MTRTRWHSFVLAPTGICGVCGQPEAHALHFRPGARPTAPPCPRAARVGDARVVGRIAVGTRTLTVTVSPSSGLVYLDGPRVAALDARQRDELRAALWRAADVLSRGQP